MNTKQLEAIRIAEWLEGIRGNTWPSYTPQEAAAELRRLQSENEQLRAGYDAARQEIASLRAQPYDQQAMGLCQVCGWKGVIDYPDGPVCVACEHDKTLSPQPAAQALAIPDDCLHIIWYDDADRKPEVLAGHGARHAAMERFKQISWQWNAHLFVRIEKNSRDAPYSVASVVPAPAPPACQITCRSEQKRLATLWGFVPAQQVVVPGVEAVSEREFKQFLSDVLTAAGLVTHGKKCKDLGRRLGEMSMRLLTAPKTAAAQPVAHVSQETFNDDGTSDIIIPALPIGMALYAAPQPAAQAGEYPDLPDLYSTGAPFWRAVLAWHDAHHGFEAINAADKLERLVADMLRAYVDADRAARGPAQAAPVDAERYRWLFDARTKSQAESVSGTINNPLPQDVVLSHLWGFFTHKAQVDEMIDAAMAAQEKP